MYQKGVPFYAQDCQDDPCFACTWPVVGRSESKFYSKELEIPFVTDARYDKRGIVRKIIDWLGEKW
jgi:hypothetical protein